MKTLSGKMDASGLKVALVVSRFNDLFTRNLVEGAKDCLVHHGASDDAIDVVWVPGSFELPSAAKELAESGRYQALIGLGVVIEGATDHASIITHTVAQKLMDLSLHYRMPIIDGVVGAKTMEQAMERCGAKQGNRGWACALVAIEMASLTRQLQDPS